jgi:hypothetical protein
MLKRVALLGFLILGFLMSPLVANLPGSAEAQWGGGWYRPWYLWYPQYYRPYYPGFYSGCCCGCGWRGGYGYGWQDRRQQSISSFRRVLIARASHDLFELAKRSLACAGYKLPQYSC